MLISRLSRIGVGIVKDISKVKWVSLCRTGFIQRSYSPRWFQFDSHPESKVFQGTIFQKHHHFFTSAASNDTDDVSEEEMISVTFVDRDGEEKHIKVPVGMSMLEAAHENDIDLEGACEGSLACSTCHVIVMDMEYYNKLEDPIDEEEDMLGLALGLTETSRLGCQVIAKPELDGMRLAIPVVHRNFAASGFGPKWL